MKLAENIEPDDPEILFRRWLFDRANMDRSDKGTGMALRRFLKGRTVIVKRELIATDGDQKTWITKSVEVV